MTLNFVTRLLADSWVHLRVALEPSARPCESSESSESPAAVRPWPIGATVIERASGQPRMVIGYKPDGRCMTVYVTPLPWMQRRAAPRIFVDDVHELSSLAELVSAHQPVGPAEETS